MSTTSPVVVDASLGVWAVLPVVSTVDVIERFVRWRQDGRELVAPMLWLAECVSAIRGVVSARVVSPEEGRAALEDLFALEITPLSMDEELCRSAYGWAERLGHSRAYDGFYLALAEASRAELWTADRRLVNGVRQQGATWARWIGEDQ